MERRERERERVGCKLTIPSSLVFSASVICSLVLYSLTILVLTSEKVLTGEDGHVKVHQSFVNHQ